MSDAVAPDGDTLLALAEETRASLPEAFGPAAAEVLISVEDWPSEDMLDELQIGDPYDLTGLYEGTPLTERSVDFPDPPSRITLFRRPILDEWSDRGDVTLRALVSHVTIHEFAHHFGWSDDDIATIDRWWE
ncbi:metallopeptidase family protein [Jannaschia aquimarina]|uniref:Possibl zinc metallo-peptidase n=1 Tax=Jannaschia aquimarina TaxID=935700 RepID=A0A0D1EH01_9RHOB|nr:metallopeptidase family protein [Jannaschia aquimarina]KIT16171.1 Possibl zinc metallo-peptidase [Jannaschia aquimarina]SNT36778.1 Predicted Zn-dependent protease, minimal metalloprotease (MMP)-like domain [Jannaschia aquimarina]